MSVIMKKLTEKTRCNQITDRTTVSVEKWTYTVAGLTEFIVFLKVRTHDKGPVSIHVECKTLEQAMSLYYQLIAANVYG